MSFILLLIFAILIFVLLINSSLSEKRQFKKVLSKFDHLSDDELRAIMNNDNFSKPEKVAASCIFNGRHGGITAIPKEWK